MECGQTGAGRSTGPQRIMDMASAFYDSCVLFAAADLGLFAELAVRAPLTDRDLAAALNLDPRGCRLLLDACVALDLLVKSDGRYRNSPEAAAFLSPASPADLSRAIRYNRDVYRAWGALSEMVRTGKPVERPQVHLGEDPARTRAFVLAMHGRAMAIGRAVVPVMDLGGCRRLLDVGGGSGAFSILAAQAHPQLHCTVLDLPAVAEVARGLVRDAGLDGRVACVAGDYRTADLPAGHDAILFSGVLHQEAPDSIAGLMRRAFACLEPGGRLCVVDMMTDGSRARPKFSALFAVNMALTAENGWVFSSEDLRAWVAEAGFADFGCRALPPPMPHWFAWAQKPGLAAGSA